MVVKHHPGFNSRNCQQILTEGKSHPPLSLCCHICKMDTGTDTGNSMSPENLAPHFCPCQPLLRTWRSRDLGSHSPHPPVGCPSQFQAVECTIHPCPSQAGLEGATANGATWPDLSLDRLP